MATQGGLNSKFDLLVPPNEVEQSSHMPMSKCMYIVILSRDHRLIANATNGKTWGQSMLVFSSIKRKIKFRVDESWRNNKVQHAISISKP
jgi:hypothetical protein